MNNNDGSYLYDGHVDYDNLALNSMYWLIRTLLSEVAEKGFPGDNHLYIGFDTTDPDVIIPKSLRERYPEEMTIVLQNRFENLAVSDEGFSVSLSFSRIQERLTIPFRALTRFFDPSCGFVLQLAALESSDSDLSEVDLDDIISEISDENITDILPRKFTQIDQEPNSESEEKSTSNDHKKNFNEDNIVSLDQFRKK